MDFVFDGIGVGGCCDGPVDAGDADGGAGVPCCREPMSGIAPPPSMGDVNPRCTINQTAGCAPGDYWTGPGSEDSEQRAYNCNWAHNIEGLRGVQGLAHAWGMDCGCKGACTGSCRGCMCGCSWCRLRQAACRSGRPPVHTCTGLSGVSACDTRWQHQDYPPTEGPTDADIRCAGCWWVKTQLGLGTQATRPPMGGQTPGSQTTRAPMRAVRDHQRVDEYNRRVGIHGGQVMEGIMLGGRPVNVGASPQRGLAAPPRQGLGAAGGGTAVAPTTVGLIAAVGGAIGLVAGGAVAAEIGAGYGEAVNRRIAVGGFMGMMFGAFAGAALAAPSTQSQSGA